MKNILAQDHCSLRVRSLLAVLMVGAFTTSMLLPGMVVAQEVTESIDNNEPLTLTTAQRAAAKITVRVRVGQGGGSGVLLAKKGSTYLVLTNAHVVQGQGGVTVVTPDGLVQVARRVQNAQVGDFDLALLEFNSGRSYDLAKFTNFENRDWVALHEEHTIVFAAGFPDDANGLKLLGGKVMQLPQEAFKNGTQVGYVTEGDLVQGMSGGPILDSFGNLVGINSTLARPVLNDYVYADGSKAPADKAAEYRQANWAVPMYNLLTRLNPDVLYSYQQLPKLQRIVAPTGYMAEFDRKARAVSVRIEKQSGGHGSGVIVAKDGDTHYVLTSEHVVINNEKSLTNLTITTADQRSHEVTINNINRYEGTDLAIVKFTSPHPYKVATLGDYNTANGIVFAGGWPSPQNINSQQWQWQWQLNPGNIQLKDYGDLFTQDKQSFTAGYDLIYRSITHHGMSGGGIFDVSGRVIGIHGKAEGITKGNYKSEIGNVLGSSLGVSIQNFLGVADKLGIKSNQLQISKASLSSLNSFDKIQLSLTDLKKKIIPEPIDIKNAKQWVEYGNQLDRLGNSEKAVEAFNRAISIQPNLLNAYYGKGLALMNDKEWSAALEAFDRAILLVPSKNQDDYYFLWKYRSILLGNLQRYPESLASISKAISLKPQDTILLSVQITALFPMRRFSEAAKKIDEIIDIEKGQKDWSYILKGVIRYRSGDKKGAFSDFDRAIKINPRPFLVYLLKGALKYKEGDKKEALNDIDIIVNMNPDLAMGYAIRSAFKADLGNYKGAFADLHKAIKIDPNSAEVYALSGFAKFKAGDKKDAFSDFGRAIEINPKLAFAYLYRGNAKSDSGDKKGAISDFDKAIKFNPEYENTEVYFQRGRAKSSLGQYKEAISDFGKAITINPEYSYAYSHRGNAKSSLGKYKEAISDCDQAISINPHAYAYSTRARAKSKSEDKMGALVDYNEAIKLDPQNELTYVSRAILKSKSGDNAGAISDSSIAIKLNPKALGAHYIRASVEFKLGDYKGAVADLNIAIMTDPQDADLYQLRGAAKDFSGDRTGAINDLKIAAQLFKTQNKQQEYNQAIELIQELSNQ